MWGQFRPKVAKSQQPDKSPYTLFCASCPSEVKQRRWPEQDFVQFVSIDPVKKKIGNFAIRIERRYHSGRIESLLFSKIDIADPAAPPPAPRKKKTAAAKKEEKEEIEVIDLTKRSGAKKTTKKLAETEEIKKEEQFSCIYDQITAFLDKHRDLYPSTHVVLVERQLPFNYFAVRIQQHVLTYFMQELKHSPLQPVLMEIDPKLKTKQLGAPFKLTEKEVKEWCVQKADELLKKREDTTSLKILEEYQKRKGSKRSEKKIDDLCDTVCQIEALCSYLEWPLTQ